MNLTVQQKEKLKFDFQELSKSQGFIAYRELIESYRTKIEEAIFAMNPESTDEKLLNRLRKLLIERKTFKELIDVVDLIANSNDVEEGLKSLSKFDPYYSEEAGKEKPTV